MWLKCRCYIFLYILCITDFVFLIYNNLAVTAHNTLYSNDLSDPCLNFLSPIKTLLVLFWQLQSLFKCCTYYSCVCISTAYFECVYFFLSLANQPCFFLCSSFDRVKHNYKRDLMVPYLTAHCPICWDRDSQASLYGTRVDNEAAIIKESIKVLKDQWTTFKSKVTSLPKLLVNSIEQIDFDNIENLSAKTQDSVH